MYFSCSFACSNNLLDAASARRYLTDHPIATINTVTVRKFVSAVGEILTFSTEISGGFAPATNLYECSSVFYLLSVPPVFLNY